MGSYTTVRSSAEGGGKFGLVTFEYKLEIGLARHIGARQDWTRGATGGCVVESLSAVRRLVGVTIADFGIL
jgi:hypothetical protein